MQRKLYLYKSSGEVAPDQGTGNFTPFSAGMEGVRYYYYIDNPGERWYLNTKDIHWTAEEWREGKCFTKK